MNKNLKKKEFCKSRKGITLIALVITIIVLLILAGISISMLAGDNSILRRAGEAREKTDSSGLKEQVQMATLAALSNENGQIKDDALRAEIKKNISGVTDNDITGNERNGWQVKVGNKAFAISKTGDINEAFWEEVRDANGDVTEIRRVDGTATGLKIGDTIGYKMLDGATTTEISSSQSVNGYEDQTIKLSDYNGTWRLLGVENGKLNLISSVITGVPKVEGDSTDNGVYTNSYFKVKGRTGYTNAESELNRICSYYGKGKYAESARSINVDDINRITGYDPEHTGVNVNKATAEEIAAGKVYGENQSYQYGNKVTFSWKGDSYPKYESSVKNGNLSQPHNWSTFKGFSWWNGTSFQKSDYTETPGKICTLTSDYYYYYPETLTTTNDTAKSVGLANDSVLREMLFNPGTDYYWLASRCVNITSYYAYFGVRFVNSGVVSYYIIAYSYGGERGVGIGLRPVVSLKSDIQLKKDDNGVWQFVEK